MLEPQLLLPPVKFRIFGTKKGKIGQNWHFWPNIGLFGPFDPLSDQKTMQKGAQVVFRCVGTKTFASSCKNYDFWPQNSHFRPKICFLQHIYRPCRLIWCPIGWLVGGCGARAITRKTPIYFMFTVKTTKLNKKLQFILPTVKTTKLN